MTNASYTPSPFPCSIVVVQTTGQLGKTFKFERKDWCVLGANEDCDVVVPFPGVAQLQALVHVKRNGVFLQGIDKLIPVRHPRLQKQLLNEEEVLLLPGDMFLLGERKFLIEYSSENATFESTHNNISCAQESNASGTTSKSPRKATPRSSRIQKKRRKSSLVVGEFDEKYVSPRSGTEKLLSKTQLARISQSEQDILPKGDAGRAQNDQETIQPHVTPQDDLLDADDLSCSSSSDESTVLSDQNDNVSRNIDFSTIVNDLPVLECNWKQPGTATPEADRKASSRQRKDLVFARLSKGLSATPRRGEQTAVIGRTDAIVQKASGYSISEETKTFAGKENLPQPCDQLPKSSKPADRKQGLDINSIRSPLSNRAQIENQVESSINQHQTPASTRRMRGARSVNSSMQTPRGRSVAFASTIELAPGAHYSPFRPKQVAKASKSISKSELKKQSGKLAGSTRTQRRQGHFLVGSPSHKQEQTLFTKNYEQGPAPTSGLEGLGTFFYSKEIPRDASNHSSQPVIEYEDDSDPPTPSSSDEGPETMPPQVPEVPGPSPMARVGGALADFLKRLSGSLESEEEDDSSPETDDVPSRKSRSLGKPEEKSSVQDLSSSEPVMSSSEVKELSRCMSPERRKEFVAQVDSAAEDMRHAMLPISEDLVNEPSCSSRETLATEEATQDVLGKDEDDSREPLVLVEENRTEDLPNGGNSGLKVGKTCEDENNVWQNPLNIGLDYEAEGEQPGPAGSNPHASENLLLGTGEYSTDSETGEEAGACEESASPEAFKDPSFVRDSADLEIEELFHPGMNGMNQPDLRFEESEGDELDYGDEEDEESMHSSDREVAAVVVDEDEGVLHHLRLGADSCSHVEDSEDEEPELEKSREFEDNGAAETETAQPTPNIKADSTFILDGKTENVENIVPSQNAVKTRISTEVEEVVEVAIEEQDENEGGETTKNEQDAIPSEMPELEDKAARIATLRKELSRLKKDELKARLVSRELDASGLKKDLVERLAIHLTGDATLAVGNGQSQEHCSTLLGQTVEKTNLIVETAAESPGSHVTPRKLEAHPKPAGADSTVQETHTMARRSGRKTRARSPSKVSVAKSSHFVAESQTELESETELDLSLYRRRTVKELRQFLKDRDLDIQQKMRKEELIQHLISLSIGSDGQNLPVVSEHDVLTAEEANDSQSSEPGQPLATSSVKSQQRMTVTQLRAQLKERGQCQAGTKKALLERLSSRPERRTRSKRTADTSSCLSCQAGKICEADATR